jgi:hypothetical protein
VASDGKSPLELGVPAHSVVANDPFARSLPTLHSLLQLLDADLCTTDGINRLFSEPNADWFINFALDEIDLDYKHLYAER